jgi:hypothetical protein
MIIMHWKQSAFNIFSRDSLLKLVILVTVLVLTNPDRDELDSHVLESFKYSFFRGVSNYMNVNVRATVSRLSSWFFLEEDQDDDVVNMLLFSYLKAGKKLFIGIGGMWIDPKYWSSLSGYIVCCVCCFSLFKIVTRTRVIGDLWNCCTTVLPFILFSATVEIKMGRRRKMAIFLAIVSMFSLLTMRITKGVEATRLLMRDIPANMLTRCCASALLAYLARAASSTTTLYYSDGLVVGKTFRWNGWSVDYSQALLCNVSFQLIAGDFPGLAASATGAVMQEIMLWLSQ